MVSIEVVAVDLGMGFEDGHPVEFGLGVTGQTGRTLVGCLNGPRFGDDDKDGIRGQIEQGFIFRLRAAMRLCELFDAPVAGSGLDHTAKQSGDQFDERLLVAVK